MSKRYLGGGVYFEQKNVSQEFSEDDAPSPAASTLAGLTDVDISNPTDGQTLVYNATSEKWENGDVSMEPSIFWLTFRASDGEYSVTSQLPGVVQGNESLGYTFGWSANINFDHDFSVGIPTNGCDVVLIPVNSLDFTNIDVSVMPTLSGDLVLENGFLYLSGNGIFSAVGSGQG